MLGLRERLCQLVAVMVLVGFLGVKGEPEWWKDTVIYQIWPRAFQDSDGDGNGDLRGISERIEYLKDLGVETICLGPIYPSPMMAAGYDVSNYTDVHPIFGDMNDLEELIESAHQREMKVMLTVVPNHSSREHTWFYDSINRIEPYTNYYVWADGEVDANGTRQPPNHWSSVVGYEDGSAWTYDENRGQWYYHKYDESLPDLNIDSDDVVEEILDIFTFWLEKDADGFLISDVPNPFEGDSSNSSEKKVDLMKKIREHIDTWSSSNNSPRKLLMADAWLPDDELLPYYEAGVIPLNFRLIGSIEGGVTAGDIKFLIESWSKVLPEKAVTNWPLSTDKHPRISTRVGPSRLPGYMVLSMLLPGQVYSYYGDEIGMTDSKAPWNDTQSDTQARLTADSLVEYSRNAPRTPMQWNGATNTAGFSTNETTYLPVNENYDYQNVESLIDEPSSTLNTYKKLVKLRKEPVFQFGHLNIGTLNNDTVLVIKRSFEHHPDYLILVNTGNEMELVNITSLYPNIQASMAVVLATDEEYDQTFVLRDEVELAPNAAVVLKNIEYSNSSDDFDEYPGFDKYSDDLLAPPDDNEIPDNFSSPEIPLEIVESSNKTDVNPEESRTTTRSIHSTDISETVPIKDAKAVNNPIHEDPINSASDWIVPSANFILGLCSAVVLIFK